MRHCGNDKCRGAECADWAKCRGEALPPWRCANGERAVACTSDAEVIRAADALAEEALKVLTLGEERGVFYLCQAYHAYQRARKGERE